MVMFKDPLQSCAWAGDAKFTARTTAAAAATSLSTSLMRDADISYASFEVFPNLLAAQRFGAYWHTAFPGRRQRLSGLSRLPRATFRPRITHLPGISIRWGRGGARRLDAMISRQCQPLHTIYAQRRESHSGPPDYRRG